MSAPGSIKFYGSDFRFELVNAGGEGLTVVMEIPLSEREFLNTDGRHEECAN